MGRFIGVLLMSLVLSLVIVLGFAYSTGGEMSQVEVNARWVVLMAKDAPAAQVAKQVYGNNPPLWAQRLAVLWERADVPRWWWLPLVLIILFYLAIALGGQRQRNRLR